MHACKHACKHAGFWGWCRVVCGLVPGGASGVLRGVRDLHSWPASVLSLVALRWPVPWPLSVSPSRVLLGLVGLLLGVGACMHACMPVSGGGVPLPSPRGWAGLCAVVRGWLAGMAPLGAVRRVLGRSGAVLGRCGGVLGWWVRPGCRWRGWRGSAGPWSRGEGCQRRCVLRRGSRAREGPSPPGVHHGEVSRPWEGPRSSPAFPGHTGSGQAQHGVLSRPPAPGRTPGR